MCVCVCVIVKGACARLYENAPNHTAIRSCSGPFDLLSQMLFSATVTLETYNLEPPLAKAAQACAEPSERG